jgi:hypothetical protein
MRRAKQEARLRQDRASLQRHGRLIGGRGVGSAALLFQSCNGPLVPQQEAPARVAKPGLRPTILAIDPAGGIAVPGLLADAANLLAVSMFQKRKPGSGVKPRFPRLADERDR